MDKKTYLSKMQEYAKEHKVPIIEPEGLEILLHFVNEKKPKRILEIGTAIGYSSAHMQLTTGAEIVTVERDETMYKKALENHQILQIDDKIKCYLDDALLIDNQHFGQFDVIYIDAEKAQNIKFVEKYQRNLAKDGIFIFDNLLFHGYVYQKQEDIPSRNLRQLIRKINDFLDFAKNHEEFDFELHEIGDGIGIMKYKGDNNA